MLFCSWIWCKNLNLIWILAAAHFHHLRTKSIYLLFCSSLKLVFHNVMGKKKKKLFKVESPKSPSRSQTDINPGRTSASLILSKWMMTTSSWTDHLQWYSEMLDTLVHIPRSNHLLRVKPTLHRSAGMESSHLSDGRPRRTCQRILAFLCQPDKCSW